MSQDIDYGIQGITSQEEFEQCLDSIFPELRKEFHLGKDVPKPEVITPEDVEKAKPSSLLCYLPGESGESKEIFYNPNSIISRKVTPPDVGEEVAHYLRDLKGPGFRGVEDLPVSEFFGHLGRRIILDSLKEDINEPEEQLEDVILIPQDNPSEVRKKLIEASEKTSSFPFRPGNLPENVDMEDLERSIKESNYFRTWNAISHYAGIAAVEDAYPEPLEDEELIYKGPGQIRDEYGIIDKELEGVEKALSRKKNQ